MRRFSRYTHEALRATPGWTDASVGIGTIVRDAWRRHLSPVELPRVRLVHEIEGLPAAGRLTAPTFVAGRAAFVAEALALRGVADALVKARTETGST